MSTPTELPQRFQLRTWKDRWYVFDEKLSLYAKMEPRLSKLEIKQLLISFEKSPPSLGEIRMGWRAHPLECG